VSERYVLHAKASSYAKLILTRSNAPARRRALTERLAAVEIVPAFMGDPGVFFDRMATERAYQDIRAYVAGLRVRLRKKGIRAHAHVLLGPIVGTIADLAAREEPISHPV
jgi:hypothetical protein